MLNPEHLHTLATLRANLGQQTSLKAAGPDSLLTWLPYLEALQRHGAAYTIEYIYCTTDPAVRQHWQQALDAPPLDTSALSPRPLPESDRFDVHALVNERYPTISGIAYRPALTYLLLGERKARAEEAVLQAADTLGIADAACYCCSFQSPLVWKGSLQDAAAHGELLFDSGHAFCLVATDFSWMIFRSEEGDWSWGFHHPYAELYRSDRPRYYVHWGVAAPWNLGPLFMQAAPALGLHFREEELEEAEEGFQASGADIAFFLIRGGEVWIEVQFEQHEGYFGWHCYTYERALVDRWRPYLKELERAHR